jgi:HK97 gp10 family phage protein
MKTDIWKLKLWRLNKVADIELKGVDEIIDKLQRIGANVGRLENQALKNAAEPVLDAAKENVPVRTGKLKSGIRISKVKVKSGVKYIQVGVDREDNSEIFYGRICCFV